MPIGVVKDIVSWQRNRPEGLEVSFHGGEPLMAGTAFFEEALPLLEEGLSHRNVKLSIQSNLWLLTEELCHLFREHHVSIGTSLDGPEDITDAQRGAGYYRRTMRGIELARTNGLDIGCICTFTPRSLPRLDEVFHFFLEQGLNFTIHACMPSLQYPDAVLWSLSADEHYQLLTRTLDLYLNNQDRIVIGTLDSMCRSVSTRQGGICTFTDCLGHHLAVGPDGSIFPCQRFVGLAAYSMGNVRTHANDTLSSSPVWRSFQGRQERVKDECGDCPFIEICHGGCPYHALASNGGTFERSSKDPHCSAYQRMFEHISERALEEVFSPENMEAVIARPDHRNNLLRRGKLISIMRDGPHPYHTARHARRILASVAMASSDPPRIATKKLQRIGVMPKGRGSEEAMINLYHFLHAPISGLINLYLQVTLDCNLRCTHCYAEAGSRDANTLPIDRVIGCCLDASRLGFRHAVITGGEPLIHPQRDRLLDELASTRDSVKPLLTVLRTNLVIEADDHLLRQIGNSVDEVVVSIDGDRETHDSRRGIGTYERTVSNLRRLRSMEHLSDVSLAAVLPIKDVNGPPGASVRALAHELDIKRVRFKPLLPLGRARDWEHEAIPETVWGHMDPRDLVEHGFTPTSTCGMGQNLYVEPDGLAYPCYAWNGPRWCLGSIIGDGLEAVIASDRFKDLGKHTVNTNLQCRMCALRFLCGGACRAWSQRSRDDQEDLDQPPGDCTPLHRRARSLFLGALERLNVTEHDWGSVGLPVPKPSPPFSSKS